MIYKFEHIEHPHDYQKGFRKSKFQKRKYKIKYNGKKL